MSVAPSQKIPVPQVLLTVAAFVIVVAGMRAASQILVPFLLAGFIAILCAPPMFWLQRRGLPTGLALLLVIGLVLAAAMVVSGVVGSSLQEFSRDLPLYEAKLQRLRLSAGAWLEQRGVDASALELTELFDPGAAMGLVATALNSLGSVLKNGFLILLTVSFMLLEASTLPAKLRHMLGDPEGDLQYLDRFVEDVKRYMAIKAVVSLVTGSLVAFMLSVLRIDFPLLWGLVAFLLNFIPNIGSIIAAIPAVLLAVIQVGLLRAGIAAAGYLAINIVWGGVVEPRFMGRGLGLSTLVVFLSLLFWGWVLGPVGMLLSVPLTITAKIALDSRPETRWLGILLGPEPRAETHAEATRSTLAAPPAPPAD